jgi:hypothetical protein
MGDPVTMAVVGAGVGALTNRRNPLQGAMMGGALGGIGGGVYGAASKMAAAAPAATQAAGIAADPALSMGAANTAAGSAMASPSFLSTLKNVPSALNTFANQNPVTTGIGLQTASSLLAEEPPAPMAPPPGLMRGQQFQMEEPMYAMAQRQPISLI